MRSVSVRWLPGTHACRAVLLGEIDERDHAGDLHFAVRTRQVYPDEVVAVHPLLLRTGTTVEHVARLSW